MTPRGNISPKPAKQISKKDTANIYRKIINMLLQNCQRDAKFKTAVELVKRSKSNFNFLKSRYIEEFAIFQVEQKGLQILGKRESLLATSSR